MGKTNITITIIGSRKNDSFMYQLEEELKSYGFDVLMPNLDVTNFSDDSMKGVIIANFARIEKSDIVIVISDKMGSSTIMELGHAFHEKKHIIAVGDTLDSDPERCALYDKAFCYPVIIPELVKHIRSIDLLD